MTGPAREGRLKANRALLLGFALCTAPGSPPEEEEMAAAGEAGAAHGT